VIAAAQKAIAAGDKASLSRPAGVGPKLAARLATEHLNRSWYERTTGQVVINVQSWVRHPVLGWMAATLDGVVEGNGAVFEAKFMLPWSFSEEAAVEKYAPQLQHNLWVVAGKTAVLSVITGGGKWVEIKVRRIRFASTSSSLLSGSSGAVSRTASPLPYSASSRRSRALRRSASST